MRPIDRRLRKLLDNFAKKTHRVIQRARMKMTVAERKVADIESAKIFARARRKVRARR